MNNLSPTEIARRIAKHNEDSYQMSVAKIEALARSVDALKLFSAVIAQITFAPEGVATETSHGDVLVKAELLGYYLYPFIGLSGNSDITPQQSCECIEALDDLLTSRLMGGLFKSRSNSEASEIDEIRGLVRLQTEIVRGSAYPEQTQSEITSIQGHYDSWFSRRAGVSPNRATEIMWAIIKSEENAMNSALPQIREKAELARKRWQGAKAKSVPKRDQDDVDLLRAFESGKLAGIFQWLKELNSLAIDILPVSRADLLELGSTVTEQEWDGLIALVGMTVEHRLAMTDPIDVRQRPMFVLPDKRVILVDISNALDALWDAFERVAKNDPGFFENYQQLKAKWLEQKVYACLSQLFPSNCLYRNLTYPDPDSSSGGTTELDAAILWGPCLVLVEAKAKQFRLQSQLGDVVRLRSDLKANVEDAFEQARRASRYVQDSDSPVFLEVGTGRRLEIPKDRIRRTYLVTVSLHLLAGLATRLSMFKGLGLFLDSDYPFSISVSDLETVTRFCDGPDVWLHYVEKRLSIQRLDIDIVGDELDLFGAYLQTRLQPSRLWEKSDKKPDMVQLAGFGERFDLWYSYSRGEISGKPSVELDVPDQIKKILATLRLGQDDAARWIAFHILDLPDRALVALAGGFVELSRVKFRPGMFQTVKCREGDTVVSIVAAPPQGTHDPLSDRTQLRAIIEKYRHKAEKSIAFGVETSDPSRLFHCAYWFEGPWKRDEQIEKAIENEPPLLPPLGAKMPGRNERCWCGSGKKYKKCHLSKV